MKSLISLLLLVLALLIAGCASEDIAHEDVPAGEAEAVEPQEAQAPEAQESTEAPEETEAAEEATPVEEKQLALGSTDIKEEEATILSDVTCQFDEGSPVKFSFRMTNTEDKEWVFEKVAYDAQDEYSHPIVVLNALQVTDAQMKDACGKKRIPPGGSAVCNFNLGTDIMVSRSLRTGLTPLGSENKNTLSLKTPGHAAELKFICE